MSEEIFDQAKILARVKKMMALANDAAATEGERDNALRMAHATLAKYNLTMAQAELSSKSSEEKRVDDYFELREYAWMRGVAYSVGQLFFCSMFITRIHVKHAKYVFIGKVSNVFTAMEMSKYVLQSIDREAIRIAKANGEQGKGTYWRNFCKGASASVIVRCKQLVHDAQVQSQTASAGTSLVLASVYASEITENRRYLEEQLRIRLKTGKNRQRAAGEGYNAGREFGSSIGLTNQVGNSSRSTKQLSHAALASLAELKKL